MKKRLLTSILVMVVCVLYALPTTAYVEDKQSNSGFDCEHSEDCNFYSHDEECLNTDETNVEATCPYQHAMCWHDCGIFHFDKETTGYMVALNDSTHARMQGYCHFCLLCQEGGGSVMEYYYTKQMWTAPHSFSFRDGGHQSGGRHYLHRDCSSCGYSKLEIISCSGPPCNIIMSPSAFAENASVKLIPTKIAEAGTNPCGHSDTANRHADMVNSYCRSIDSLNHGYYEEWTYKCGFCAYVIRIDRLLVSYAPHSFVLLDLGHQGNNHIYRNTCHACSYYIPYAIPCTGNPHVGPMRMPEDPEELII